MITPLIFGILVCMDFAFILFAMLDHGNRVYGDIVAGILATVLSGMLANYIISGLVVADGSTPILDGSIGYFFVLIACVIGIITVKNVWDVVMEYV